MVNVKIEPCEIAPVNEPYYFDETNNIKQEKGVQYVLVIPAAPEYEFDENCPKPKKIKLEEELDEKSAVEQQNAKTTKKLLKGHTTGPRKRCKICSAEHATELAMRLHRKEKHFVCDKCNFPSKDAEFLRQHICSRKLKSFKCDWCSKEFGSVQNLIQHVNIHREDIKEACKFCGKRYVSIRLVQHIRIMHTETNLLFSCDYCPHTVKVKCQLQYHMKAHFKPFECHICKKKFSEERYFKEHKLNHKTANPFACKKCGRGYTRKTSLHRHMKTAHSFERNFACKLCSYRGKTKDDLTTHAKIHSKAYVCDFCSKKFSRSTHLKEHRELHINPEVFQCNVCYHNNRSKRSLIIHMRTHIQFLCDHCQFTTKKKYLIEKHLKEFHKTR